MTSLCLWFGEKQKTIHQIVFCSTDTPRISSKSKHMVIYPNLPSSMKIVPHSDKLPVSEPQNNVTTDKDNSDADEFHPPYSSKLP
jgi:hypothetical protein